MEYQVTLTFEVKGDITPEEAITAIQRLTYNSYPKPVEDVKITRYETTPAVGDSRNASVDPVDYYATVTRRGVRVD